MTSVEDKQKLETISKKTFKEQAIWYLNATYGVDQDKNAEDLWNYVNKFAEYEIENHEAGCALDELNMHRVLEFFNLHKTIRDFRDDLRAKGIEIKRTFSLMLFFIWNYNLDIHKIVNAPQGAQSAELAKAQEMLDQCQKMLEEATKKASEAALKEKELANAEREVQKALDELKKQEDEFNNKTKELENVIATSTGVVKKNKAQAELSAHLASDPLPLRKAKTTTEAAKRKAEKALNLANEALAECQKKFNEAEEYLNEQKANASAGMGSIWWMERELAEKKKYMPQKKGGVAK